jgi:hypothetical protein
LVRFASRQNERDKKQLEEYFITLVNSYYNTNNPQPSMSNYHIKHLEEYYQVYRKSVREPENFWEEIAEEHFIWRKKWNKVLSWDFTKPEVKWFEGAQLNITENCIDRHLATRGDKTAILFEPNNPDEPAEHITYKQLYARVNKFANVLKAQGVKKGDRVCVYVPMIPELARFITWYLQVFRQQPYPLGLMIPIVKW